MSPWIDTHIKQLTSEQDSWQQNQGRDYLDFALGASPAVLIYGEHGHPLDNLLNLPTSVVSKMPPMLLQVNTKAKRCHHLFYI